MFFFKDFQKIIVNIHLKEKILFYDLQGNTPSSIDTISIKYKVFYDVFEKKLFTGTQLFFYQYFNSCLKYKNYSSNNHICYSLSLPNSIYSKYNILYSNFLTLLNNAYNNFFFVQEKKNYCMNVQIRTLVSFASTDLFFDIVSVNSLLHISFNSKIYCFFLYKIYLSHLFFNV